MTTKGRNRMDVDTGIDIKELACLIYVVEMKSFSLAAEHLNLSQPTVSAHILALEHKVGMRLVVRSKSGSRPTDAGKILYCHAKDILQLRQNAREAMRFYSETL